MTHVDYPRHAPQRSAEYRASGAWADATVAQQWQQVADERPDRVAVVALDGRATYRELSQRSDRVAAGLLAQGLEPGDRVLLQTTNRLATVIAWYGVLKAGLVPVCTLAAHRHHEILEIGRRSGAVAHLVDAGVPRFDMVAFAEEIRVQLPTLRVLLTVGAPAGAAGLRVEDLAADGDAEAARDLVSATQAGIDPQSVAVLQLSGGTTGTPKLIPRLHCEYWYNARLWAETLGWDESVVTAHIMPIAHNAGVVIGLHAAHSVGGTAVVLPPVLDLVLPVTAAEGVTDMALTPAFATWTMPLLEQAKRLRRVVIAGAKPAEGQFEAFEAAGVWVGQNYGMAEGFFALTPLDTPAGARRWSVGVPMAPQDEIRLLEPGSEEPVGQGEVGEICVRGPYTIAGYLGAPEHNQRAFTSGGFYRTGDLGLARVEDGYACYSIEGRIKDVIDRGGEKISVDEVEALLAGLPQLAEIAVVAMPDARLGQRGCAYVVPAPGAEITLQVLQDHLAKRGVAKFKWPEHVEVVKALPRTAVGKVDKKMLREDIVEKLDTVPL
jgi:2,3-dihydroxybenzoate-AMP ligase